MLFEAPATGIAEGDNVPARMMAAARRHPDKPALICDGEVTSWGELADRIERIANQLLALGAAPGDNIAILSRNSPEYVALFLGILRAGMCVTPLSTMADSQSLRRMVESADAKVLFLSDELRPLADPFVAEVPCLLPGGRIAIDFEAPGWQAYEPWMRAGPTTDPEIAISGRDGFNIIYSSGTTGVPKGILHSHEVRAMLCDNFANFGFDGDAVTLLSTPLYSNTTIVTFLPTVAMGATVVLMRKFDVAGYLRLAEKYRCSHTMLVPVQYHRLMTFADFDRFDLSAMKVKLSTSAPLRASLKRDILDRFPGLMIEIYGLTEGGGASVLNCNEFPDKLASVGQAGLDTELKIIDAEGHEVAPGGLGEIVARSPNMMNGYYGRDDLTGDILWRDRGGRVFFRSGDIGRLDEDGFLFLGDRLKDMIISGGLNIYANDLELVLLGHEAVDDVAVIAMPSEEWGETPLGLVVLKPGNELSAETLRDWANGRLGKAQRLRAIEFRDRLPRSSIGKILKRELRAPYWAGRSESGSAA